MTISIFHSDAQVRGEFMPPTNMAQAVRFTGEANQVFSIKSTP